MSTATTTAHSTEDGALRWFRRLMWAGIIANVVVGIASIAYTPQVLALAKVDPATPLVWPRLSAMLVMLLAGFYIPAAIDPCAHRFSAVFAVVCRFAGTIFMAVVGGHYIIFGLLFSYLSRLSLTGVLWFIAIMGVPVRMATTAYYQIHLTGENDQGFAVYAN